jgi:O-6-methylguanine DNA methyltransferase
MNHSSYQSIHDFKSLFSDVIENAPTKEKKCKILHAIWIETSLGPLLGIGDEKKLYLLEFVDWRGLAREIGDLRGKHNASVFPGLTPPLISIKDEIKKYFKGTLKQFKTPLYNSGSLFQKEVWAELKKIPYGQTRSYYDIAMLLGKPTAYRAVANANGKNKFAIVIPCHRVINHSGALGGYGGGLERKQWLIDHEKNISHN